MAFLQYVRTTPRPVLEDVPPLVPLTMLDVVQRSFVRRVKQHVAFKIVPADRLTGYLPQVLHASGWGMQLMFTGGQLGAIVAPDLARKATAANIFSVSWDFPANKKGDVFHVYSVAVKSSGNAESFPKDLLMAELAPDLADETVGAHVFHFFDERSSLMFQYLLGCEIDTFSKNE